MQFYYGEKMPLRILDEGEFWKQQEAEHTVVIRELVKGLEEKFVRELKEWRLAFEKTQGLFVRYVETVVRLGHRVSPMLMRHILQLVYFSLKQSEDFIRFLNRLKTESEPVKNNLTVIVVINHIIRESEYFVGISQAFL